jgi:protein gp37
MAENSKIAWTDHTFNPWIGCTKVSEGCKFCYAEELMDKRYRKVQWGPQGTRVRTAAANWKKPLQWNQDEWRECLDCGFRGKVEPDQPYYLCRCLSRNTVPTRQRVFCASLADVFEDNKQVFGWRIELWELIAKTPNLDWLVLTKRPQSIAAFSAIWPLPGNVWIGTTVESQEHFDSRVAALLDVPAIVHFLSVEPMLGPVRIPTELGMIRIDWVICGGESSAKARPMNLDWARDLRDDCLGLLIPFFMKQLGGYPDKRDELTDFPEDLRIREWPIPSSNTDNDSLN